MRAVCVYVYFGDVCCLLLIWLFWEVLWCLIRRCGYTVCVGLIVVYICFALWWFWYCFLFGYCCLLVLPCFCFEGWFVVVSCCLLFVGFNIKVFVDYKFCCLFWLRLCDLLVALILVTLFGCWIWLQRVVWMLMVNYSVVMLVTCFVLFNFECLRWRNNSVVISFYFMVLWLGWLYWFWFVFCFVLCLLGFDLFLLYCVLLFTVYFVCC